MPPISRRAAKGRPLHTLNAARQAAALPRSERAPGARANASPKPLSDRSHSGQFSSSRMARHGRLEWREHLRIALIALM